MFPYHTKLIVIFCMIFLLKINFWTVDSQPVAICPSNATFSIELGSQGIVIFWEEPTILGSSEDVTLISQSHSNDTIFPPGVTEVMFTFTDAPSGSNFSCSFFVEIIPIDTTPPVITGCSMDLSPCPPFEQPYIEVNFTEPTATDISGSVYLQSASHKPGDLFMYGRTPVTYEFSDPAGNVATCRFYISIVHGNL
ncbi:Hyalin [Holothuria leucospilota]|uniref:Hyalin n=1 Tax=Holothuria leucospilota TaxID=206669 RepID=A0A9Q1CB48_HOLLE|nr:Hyalin [Holothuria leucospilota]